MAQITQEELNNLARSVAYHVAFTTLTLGMGILCLPLLAIKHPALTFVIPYKWTGWALDLQRYILGLDYEVRSVAPLSSGGVIYAVKHQSAWETLALWHILDRPVFVLKKELLSIPIFGWYLRQADNIVIDRSSGQKAVGQMIEQGMKYLMEGRNIVIFPEGTRTPAGETTRYKGGIASMYEALAPKIYPVALNSGCFWGRNALVRKPGTVEVEVLEPMPQGLPKSEFLEQLQQRIETATAPLVANPKYPPPPDYY